MNPARRFPSRAAAARARLPGIAAFALAVLLLGAQTLGLWHRAEHRPATHAEMVAHGDGHASVFGHGSDESASCRLYDQLTLGDALRVAAVVLPVFEPVRVLVAPRIERVARSAPAPYRARGPPAFG